MLENGTKISTKVENLNDISKIDTFSLEQVLWNFSKTGSSYQKSENISAFDSVISTNEDIKKDFKQMIKSVCAYGGFYMSSYQIGNVERYWPEESVLLDKYIPEIQNNRLNTSISSSGYELIEGEKGISFNYAKEIAKRMYSGDYDEDTYVNNDMEAYKIASKSVESDIIWGNQWDAVLSWMFEKTIEEDENIGKKYVVEGQKYQYETVYGNKQDRGFNNIYQMFYYEKDTSNESKWVGKQYIQLFNNNMCYMRGASESPNGYCIDSETNELYTDVSESKSAENSIRVTLTVKLPE